MLFQQQRKIQTYSNGVIKVTKAEPGFLLALPVTTLTKKKKKKKICYLEIYINK